MHITNEQLKGEQIATLMKTSNTEFNREIHDRKRTNSQVAGSISNTNAVTDILSTETNKTGLRIKG